MKTNFLKLTALLILAVTLYACNDEQIKPNDNDNMKTTEQVVAAKGKLDKTMFSLSSALRENEDVSGGRIASRLMRKNDAARLAENWGGCALASFTENADNSWTIKLDYGDGCADGDKFTKGVVSFTWKSTSNTSGVHKVIFENFSESKVGEQNANPGSLNGFYESQYSFEFEELEDTTDVNYSEAIKTELEVRYKNGSKDKFKAEGNLITDIEGTRVNSLEFSGSTANNDVFSGNVVEPLFFSFSCTDTYIYVTGTEAIDVNGKSSVIDYGDGQCDNIFTIRQDGVTITIDLDEVDG